MTVSLAVAVLLTLPAVSWSQARFEDADFENRLSAIREAAHAGKEASEKARRDREEAVRSALTGMNDGNPSGEAADVVESRGRTMVPVGSLMATPVWTLP